MGKNTKKTLVDKPLKPYEGFPLFPHLSGQWAKKIRGRLFYFGTWNDPDAALKRYLDERDALHAGRPPRVTNVESLTVRDLANRFLATKKTLVGTGELSSRTFAEYHAACERIVEAFGRARLVEDLAAEDFEQLRRSMAKTWGVVRLGNEIQRVRSIFKYAFDQGLIDKPIRYGQVFRRPTRKTLRKARNAKGPRVFEADEIRVMLNAANVQIKAMILLGINCAFGNADVAALPQRAIDLNGGWIAYPRSKTGMERRCPLWNETITALRKAIASRPAPKDEEDNRLVFITQRGLRWMKDSPDNPISKEIAKLVKSLGIWRHGVNFYALRHTFATIGGESLDQVAVDFIMGRSPVNSDMAGKYRERVADWRLKVVTNHVHQWLFGSNSAEEEVGNQKTARRHT